MYILIVKNNVIQIYEISLRIIPFWSSSSSGLFQGQTSTASLLFNFVNANLFEY